MDNFWKYDIIKETLIKANFQEYILVNLRKEVFPLEMAD